ncbi:MAG: LysR family transcriptional regulator [Bdellovibrionales bacterium]|nr:LysR family transcriptional regulator [Bdellovibrionales bacterium]
MNHLRSFYQCALYGNVSKAAHSLQMTQPSLSQKIKTFEDEIGLKLFYRNGRTLELTSDGRNLFLKSKKIFESLGDIENYIKRQPELCGPLYFGFSHEIERPFMAKIIGELIKNPLFKKNQFYVSMMNHSELRKKINSKNISFFLTHQNLIGPLHKTEFNFPVNLVSKVKDLSLHKLNKFNVESMILALGQKLILPSPGLKLREELDSSLDLKELKSSILMESNILSCLTEGVRSGAGCGFLPLPYVYEEIHQSHLSIYGPIRGFWNHKLYLLAHKSVDPFIYHEIKQIIQRFSVEKGVK